MKKLFRFISPPVLGLALSACSVSWGNYRTVSLDPPAGIQDAGPRVTGSSCGISYWFFRNPENAVHDALRKAPGAKGLRDVEIRSNVFLLFVQCVEVTGVPVA